MTIDGFTEVLMPTERKHEYCMMMGVLKFSKPALGQMYHCGVTRVSTCARMRETGGGETYCEDEGQGQEDTDGEADGHHVVDGVGAEHLGSETTPRDGVGVVALGVLARPETGTRDGEEGVTVSVNDRNHHDVCGCTRPVNTQHSQG